MRSSVGIIALIVAVVVVIISIVVFDEDFNDERLIRDLEEWKKGTDVYLRKYGYDFEFESFTTSDNFTLRFHHVWNSSTPTPRVPILCLSGITLDADSYFINNVEENFALFLASQGYDIWALSFRGSRYSQIDDDSWRNLTLDNQMRYDAAEGIDFILEKTGQPNLNIVSLSKGTTITFGLLASKPEYNRKVRMNFAIVPVTYLSQPVPVFYVMMHLLKTMTIWSPEWILRITNFKIRHDIPGLSEAVHLFALKIPLLFRLFQNLQWRHSIDFSSEIHLDVAVLRRMLARGFMSNLWIQELLHYTQMSLKQRMQTYSSSWENGLSDIPKTTEYDMMKITTPHMILEVSQDVFSQDEDYKRIRNELCDVLLDGKYFPDKYALKVTLDNYQHGDPMWAKNNLEIYGKAAYAMMREHDIRLNSTLQLAEIVPNLKYLQTQSCQQIVS